MRSKRKSVGIIAAVLLLFTMVMGIQGWLPVYAEDFAVSINGEALQDGKYYTFDEVNTWNSTCTMKEWDAAPTDETAYIHYHDSKMEVHGEIKICANENSQTEVLKIANGTLTLTGDGNLTIENYRGNTDTLITGTADAELKTENYTGNITLNGWGGEALIRDLKQVDLRSSAAEITLEGTDLQGDAYISAGSVWIEAGKVFFSQYDNVAVEYAVEATDIENGEIHLIDHGTNQCFQMSDTISGGVNASEALFKGTKIFLVLNFKGTSSNLLKGNAIAEGDLSIKTKAGIQITAQNNLVNGNLDIEAGTDRSYMQIQMQSDSGTVSTGNTKIEAPVASVTINTNGDVAAICGNAEINATRITMTSKIAVIAGDARLQAKNAITLTGATEYPVIAGRTIQLNVSYGNISIARTGNAASGRPMFNGSLQTRNAIVKYADGDTKWAQVTATGQSYYAENCAHPIVDGYSGYCMVCGDHEIDGYAELIGADGVVKRTLERTFAGTGSNSDQHYVQDGDTIRFTRDVYADGMTADFSSKGVTLDLNGHTLNLKKITTESALAMQDGTYEGAIESSDMDETKVCTLRNVKATLTGLQWKSAGGVELAGSEVTVADNAGTASCWLEKLAMDPASVLTVCDAAEGIANTAQVSLEEGFGDMTEFLPTGYTFAYIKKDADTEYRNTVLDEDGQIARNVVLRYRRMTDADVSVTVKPATCTYDATAKTPEVIVTYAGKTLIKDTDYTVAYADNIHVGSAVITITGKGRYHDAVQVRFTIEKAAQAAPTGLVAVNVSKAGANDGAIHNVSTAMEYSTDAVHWTRVSAGTSVSGLAAGSYYVRYAQTENYLASPSATVVIAAPAEATTEGGTTTETGTTTDGQNTSTPAKKGTKLTTAQATVKVTNVSAKDPQVSYEAPKSKKAKNVTVPDTVKIDGVTYKVTSVAKNAFASQKQLKSVTIGKHVTTIGERAFAGCKKLETITIGKSVTKIGKNAFTGCKNLKKITILTTKLTKKSVAKDAFKGISADVKIVVPKKKLKAYKTLFRQKGLSKKVKFKTI